MSSVNSVVNPGALAVRRWKSRGLSLSGVLLLALLLQAHKPVFKQPGTDLDSALHIDDPTISWAFYGTLDQSSAEWFRFNGRRGLPIFIQLLVPQSIDLSQVSLRAILIGPGLPESPLTRTMVMPAGFGAIPVELNGSNAGTFREKFTQVRYQASPPLRMKLPADGAYGILVSGANAPYVLAVGSRESFEALDVLRFPMWWKQARKHAGVAVWHGYLVGVFLLSASVWGVSRLVRKLAYR